MIPLAVPEVTQGDIEAVQRVLESRWLTSGEEVELFANELGQLVGAEYVVPTTSCTAALHLALLAAGIGPGDEVITTPVTFVSTVSTILHTGATPVLADICFRSGNIDPISIASKVTDRTKAVVVMHLAGLICEMPDILAVCRSNSLLLIEDSAHAIGARALSRYAGALGDVGAFSFHPTKNVTTGEGGALVTNDERIFNSAKSLSFHGINRNLLDRTRGKGQSWVYDVTALGWKYNMSNLQAALGRQQLLRIDSTVRRRRELVDVYRDSLANNKNLHLPEYGSGDEHAHHLFYVRLSREAVLSRDELSLALNKKGIATGMHYIPIPCYSYYKQTFGWRLSDYPSAKQHYDSSITLPLFNELEPSQVSFICDVVNDLLPS